MRIRVLIVMSLTLAAILACAMDKEMGELTADSSPIRFTLFGETIYTWKVAVSPGIEYEIVIENYAAKQYHPVTLLDIGVSDAKVRGSNLINAVEPNEDTITVIFIGPPSGKVNISVSSKVWEGQEEIGTLTILVRERAS